MIFSGVPGQWFATWPKPLPLPHASAGPSHHLSTHCSWAGNFYQVLLVTVLACWAPLSTSHVGIKAWSMPKSATKSAADSFVLEIALYCICRLWDTRQNPKIGS